MQRAGDHLSESKAVKECLTAGPWIILLIIFSMVYFQCLRRRLPSASKA
jgi:hypothetical protein